MSLYGNPRLVFCLVGLAIGVFLVGVVPKFLKVQPAFAGQVNTTGQSSYTIHKVGTMEFSNGEKRQASDEPLYAIIGPDGYIWFAQIADNVVLGSKWPSQNYFIKVVHEHQLSKGDIKNKTKW